MEEAHRVRDDLTTRVADAFERYNTNRLMLEDYRASILTDQVEAYLGAYERHQQEPDKVGFGDVVAAQQALATTISSYVTTLGNLWTAVADLSTLLQTDDLFQAAEMEQVPPVPDLEHLPELALLPSVQPGFVSVAPGCGRKLAADGDERAGRSLARHAPKDSQWSNTRLCGCSRSPGRTASAVECDLALKRASDQPISSMPKNSMCP